MKRLLAAAVVLSVLAATGTASAASSWSTGKSGSGTGKAAQLAPPATVSITCDRPNRATVNISWSAAGRSSFAGSFEVIRSTSSALTSPTIITTVPVTAGMPAAQSSSDTAAISGTYYYAVRTVGNVANTWVTNSTATAKTVVTSPQNARACV